MDSLVFLCKRSWTFDVLLIFDMLTFGCWIAKSRTSVSGLSFFNQTITFRYTSSFFRIFFLLLIFRVFRLKINFSRKEDEQQRDAFINTFLASWIRANFVSILDGREVFYLQKLKLFSLLLSKKYSIKICVGWVKHICTLVFFLCGL